MILEIPPNKNRRAALYECQDCDANVYNYIPHVPLKSLAVAREEYTVNNLAFTVIERSTKGSRNSFTIVALMSV